MVPQNLIHLARIFVITKANAKDNLPQDFYVNALLPKLKKHIVMLLTLLNHILRGGL